MNESKKSRIGANIIPVTFFILGIILLIASISYYNQTKDNIELAEDLCKIQNTQSEIISMQRDIIIDQFKYMDTQEYEARSEILKKIRNIRNIDKINCSKIKR